MAAQRSSSVVGVARAVLTVAATLGLARVFADASWFVPVVLAAVVPHALFTFAARRHWHALLACGVVFVAGWWLTMLVDAPGTVVLGIPSGATFETFFSDLGNAPDQLRSAVVPVEVGGAALLLAVIATYVAAALSEWCARFLDAPLGAIGASVALFISIAALGDGSWVATTALYGLAVLGYLLALHHADVTRRRTWFHAPGAQRSQMLIGGAIAGAVVLLTAIVVGPSVPGARGEPMLDYRSLGTGNEGSVLTADPPILSIRDKLQEPNNAEIFTVETDDDRGWYWRAIALDHLADETWTVPPTDAEPASNLDTPDSLPTSVLARQRFDLRDLDAFWLPAAYRPTRIDLDDAQVVPKSLTLYRPSGGLRDIQYTVESQVPQPTEAELDAVTWDDVADQPELTELPDGFSQRVRDLAADVTDNGASSPYEAAAAIEAYFSPENGFTYTLDTDLHSSSSAHEAFLFDTKAGFCEQYASAFAVMARSVGLPTRVAVGYQSGELRSDRRWHVTNRDAHAWPEVWLGSTIGWYAFEPTPGRTNPATGRGTAPEAGSATTTTTPTSSGATTPTSSGASDPGPVRPGEVAADGSPITSPTNDDTTQRTLLALGAILAAAILGAIVVLVVAIVRAWLRTRRRRHDPDPRRRVLGAWAEALERMVAAGVDPRPSATPTEFALRYAPAHGAGAAGPPLMELARLQTEAMFAAESPSDDDAAAAWRHVDEIDRELKRAVSFRNRWYRRLRPEPRPEIEREPTEDSIRDRSALVEASVE